MDVQGIKLSIIMPVYNERDTVGDALERVLRVDLSELSVSKEIIIVDDGSTDGTREFLKEVDSRQSTVDSKDNIKKVPAVDRGPPAFSGKQEGGLTLSGPWTVDNKNTIKIFYHEKNQGKGAAIRTGFAGASGDVLVVHDADMEYDPEDFRKMLKPILEGKSDVVYGSRFIERTEYAHLRFKLGNILFSFLISVLFGTRITDSYTCYKMFRRRILESLVLESSGFEIEAELTIKFLKAGYRIYEMPISYRPRSIEEGKKIGWRDARVGLLAILKYRFRD